MGKGDFNLNGKASNKVNKTKVSRGNTQDLLKQRNEQRAKLIPEIEAVLNDWDGGGLCIVYNRHDENNNITGAQVMVIGAEHTGGLMKLAKAVHMTSKQIIHETVESMSKEGVDGILDLMKAASELMDDTEEED